MDDVRPAASRDLGLSYTSPQGAAGPVRAETRAGGNPCGPKEERKGTRMPRHLPEIGLRPVTEADLAMLRRFSVEPGLIGLDWSGFRDPGAIQRRFDTDSYLGEDNGRLIVEVAASPPPGGTGPGWEPAGFVSYSRHQYCAQAFCWETGIALLPRWRGQGIGWRAQAALCSYLFDNTPVQRTEAITHADNIAEQRSLRKAGFTLEGVIRAGELRAGQWRDCHLYSRLRTDPDPLA
jgi:[ribosomal protein S5]-alanine N-acetyltransferase